MSGITKIHALSNIGIFEGFQWPKEPTNLSFNKVNLLYGYNGSGKTTLAKEICKNLFWSKFSSQAKRLAEEYRKEILNQELPDESGVEFLKFLDAQKTTLSAELVTLERERLEKLAQFKQESKFINDFLVRLCVLNFQVDVGNGEDGLRILYKSGQQKKGVRNSLSDGEKTALAFAYFLSKYKFEVIDNSQVNESDCIVVLDDPVSSLDENRLYSTALVIRDFLLPRLKDKTKMNWEACKQTFIFSHNLIFLKFMGNILEHKSSFRADFYLEKGRIQKLPRSLDSYHTSYFYKLEKIQAYCDGRSKYDDVCDNLANSIRVVLEVFLSFKFGRLKEKTSLGELISHLSGYNFDNFTPVGDISDQRTLKEALFRICKIVNPESHGTPQNLTHIEYLPEAELKEIAQKTLGVIEFLDQMHFKVVLELSKIAA